MSPKEALTIPPVFLDNSVDKLVSSKFSQLNHQDKNDLLNGYIISIQERSLREVVLLNAINLIQNESITKPNPTNNSQIAPKLLTIIALNQTDRYLEPAWQAMLDKETKLKNPLHHTLLKTGHASYGMYGLTFMPNENNDYTSPPFDVIPKAFSQWTKTINPDDLNFEIKQFQQRLSSVYSNSDCHKLYNLLNISSI